jgi:hypothetical protein
MLMWFFQWEHLLHVLGGAAVLAGLLFGFIAVLVFLHNPHAKTPRNEYPKGPSGRGGKALRRRPKRKRGMRK